MNMKMCDRCRVPGCLLNYNGKACKKARKEYCPEVVYTNADRIHAMTDEELAKFLCAGEFCDICEEGCENCRYDGDCERRIADWLQQPAEECK